MSTFTTNVPKVEDFFRDDGKGFSAAGFRYLSQLGNAGRILNTLKDGDVFTDELSGKFSFPEAKTEEIICDAKFVRSIIEVTTHTAAGTAILTPKIGSTALGGGANSASTTKSTVTHSADNELGIGQTLNFTLSSVSSDCVDLAWTVKFTRAVLAD